MKKQDSIERLKRKTIERNKLRKIREKKNNALVMPHPGHGYPVIIEIGHILLNTTCNSINPNRASKADRAYFFKSL